MKSVVMVKFFPSVSFVELGFNPKKTKNKEFFSKKRKVAAMTFLKLFKKHSQRGGPRDLSLLHDKYLYGE